MKPPLIAGRDLWKTYSSHGRVIQALAGVSLEIGKGESVALVGASASGKSTLGRILLGLEEADRGEILLRGNALSKMSRRERSALKGRFQAVFQDPASSLNHHLRVESIIAEPLLADRDSGRNGNTGRIRDVLLLLGLDMELLGRSPRGLSGGEAQRVALARALVRTPDFLLLDEATSALDAPVRAELLELLEGIRETMDLSMLVITHDFSVASRLCSRGLVMDSGRFVEEAAMSELLEHPRHPVTRALLEAGPVDGKCVSMEGKRSG